MRYGGRVRAGRAGRAAETGPGAGPGAALPDEDVLVPPESWRALALPWRRDGAAPTGAVETASAAVTTATAVATATTEAAAEAVERRRIADNRRWIDLALDAPDSHPPAVRAARAHLRGMPDPLGAVTVAALLWETWGSDGFAELVDSWIVRFGLGFAARAALTSFEVDTRQARPNRHVCRLLPGDPEQVEFSSMPLELGLAIAVRRALAAADAEQHRAAVAELTAARSTATRRAVTAFLAPDVPGWVDGCLDEEPGLGTAEGWLLRTLLLFAVRGPEQVERLPAGRTAPLSPGWTERLAATLAAGPGAAGAPLLVALLDRAHTGPAALRLAELLAEFPSDAAFGALLDRISDHEVRPVLLRAVDRRPVRAFRLLAAAARAGGRPGEAARQLLDGRVAALGPELPALLARLDGPTAAFVGALDDARERGVEAPVAALPALLVAPPWLGPRTAHRPKALTGVEPDPAVRVVWRDGEAAAWARDDDRHRAYPEGTDWRAEAERRLRTGGLWYGVRLLVEGPAEVLAPYLATWRPADFWADAESLRPVLAKYGEAAVPLLREAALVRPGRTAQVLLPVLDAGAAGVMADALLRLKSLRPTARSWFERHGVAGALLLAPAAVGRAGRAGRARDAAEHALRLVAGRHGADVLLAAVTERLGARVAAEVRRTLAADPLVAALPARLPEPAPWLHPGVLPRLLLRDDGSALPPSAVRHVLTMAALGRPRDPYPGLPQVAALLRPESTAAFARALFEEWRLAGMPAADAWALHLLGEWGDDGAARRLATVLCEWPGQGAHRRAAEGLDVLAALGTDTALRQLHSLAQRVRFKGLRTRAQEKVAEVAEALGLTPDRLADRLVPDLGLSPDGTTVLDYGARTFTVGLDEQLRPYVLDGANGRRRKDLPAPGPQDDPEAAAAARKRYAALKKDARALATEQLTRLEAAMVSQRSWETGEFTDLLVAHPLLGHPVRQLLWTADGTAFRIAEDGTPVDVHDVPFPLPAGAEVRLAHPALPGPDLAAWTARFAERGLAQPFPQLTRPVDVFTPEEAAGYRLHRFERATVPTGRLLSFARRSWQRGTPEDGGVERWFHKPLPDGRHLVVQLRPGICVGLVGEAPEQTFETVWLDTRPGDHWPVPGRPPERLGTLDPVTSSELLTELGRLTSP
ncbi:DUF4132 domain-containing protein [Kitasatospora sp. NPDC088391]|uniref:DUF4132 domain-containing protein n=1 Tax=Kitasatospora sp. NPDC088391 TaxID=3364074 RepID=UPI0038155001